MRFSSRRGATTIIEILVAMVVAIMVIGGAWVLFAGASRTGMKVMEYSSVLESSASIQARLVLDLAAAYMPSGIDARTSPLFVSEDGRRISFFTHKRIADPEASGPSISQFRRVVPPS